MATVRDRFGIDTMAASLAGVYAAASRRATAHRPPGARPRDAARHQPRLRLAPLPARHPRNRLARRGGAGRRRDRPGDRRASCATSASSASDLRLGRGSNPGVIRAEEQPKGEDDSLRGLLRRHPARRRRDARLPGAGPRRRPALGPRRRGARRAAHRRRGCGPTTSSSTTSPSAPGSASSARASSTPTSCSATRPRYGGRRGLRLPAGLPARHRARPGARSRELRRLCVEGARLLHRAVELGARRC